MDTGSTPMYGWNDLPWKKFERQVFKLAIRGFIELLNVGR
jgi:hypothetical protein